MPTDPTPLAQRLRDMAGKLAFDEVRKWHVPEANRYGGVVHPMGPTEKDVGRAIVPALLRELANWCDEDISQCRIEVGPDDFRAWADSIEKGVE